MIMNSTRFLNLFSPVIQAFRSDKFPAIVLERIEKRTADLTDSEMRRLCDRILDHCDHPPSIAKIMEHANAIRAGRSRAASDQPLVKDCAHCRTLGYHLVYFGTVETIMICDCENGKEHHEPIMRWSHEWSLQATRKPCPFEWFSPVNQRAGTQPNLKDPTMVNKMSEISCRRKLAIEFWQSEIIKRGRETA